MYKGYQLNNLPSFTNTQVEKGKELYTEHKIKFKEAIEEHLNEKGQIEVDSIESRWFPLIDADIFISHSSTDSKEVYGLAGWLYENFKLKAFVDSAVWGNANELLKDIDDKYCKREEMEYYSYEARNHSTSHVHMILSMALTKMIDKTECILFYKTPNSIKLDKQIEKTTSPWIYAELIATQVLRRHKKTNVLKYGMPVSESVQFPQMPDFLYETPLSKIPKLNKNILEEWKNSYDIKSGINALDELYRIHEKQQ